MKVWLSKWMLICNIKAENLKASWKWLQLLFSQSSWSTKIVVKITDTIFDCLTQSQISAYLCISPFLVLPLLKLSVCSVQWEIKVWPVTGSQRICISTHPALWLHLSRGLIWKSYDHVDISNTKCSRFLTNLTLTLTNPRAGQMEDDLCWILKRVKQDHICHIFFWTNISLLSASYVM